MQTLPDQFYYLLMGLSTASLLVTGRVIPLILMWWWPSSDRNNTQLNRYFTAAVGLIVSAAYFIFLLLQYTPSEIILGIHELPMFFSILYWTAIGMNAACVVLSIAFAVRSYRHPAHIAKFDRSTKLPVYTDKVRTFRSR